MKSITLYKDVEAEFDVEESDIIDIFRDLSYKEMMEYWETAHNGNSEIVLHDQYCYDVLFDEWFGKVKEQYSLQQAENLISVK